jgi:uncharacterized protein YutE (UPF0331/DUF86 family)
MADVVIVNKAASIERWLKRIDEDYTGFEAGFETDFMRQDAVILNLQRACEQSIDLANHLIKKQKLGVPQNSKHAFEILSENGFIDQALARRLSNMAGFRNIAVHEYSSLDIAVVKSILEKHLDDFRGFVKAALQYA